MLLTQQYLQTHSLADLTEQYGISVKRHGDLPNLVFFKYNQLNSPMGKPIVQECRGLILDEAKDWSVVSFPFRKFFNEGEGHAAPIDWSTAKVYEKLDGSLMTLYPYPYRGEWRVASNGLPDASGGVGWGSKETFADLFWATWGELGYQEPAHPRQPRCFIFELMTPYNQVVVRHQKPRLALIGVRNLATLEEEDPEPWADHYRWDCAATYRFGDLAAIRAHADLQDPAQFEGFVVRDAQFNRIKVKNAQYVALAHLKDSVGSSRRNMLDLVRKNEGAEFLAYFPALRKEFEAMQADYLALVSQIDNTYRCLRPLESQKEFAAAAIQYPFSWVLFLLRKHPGQTALDLLSEVHVEKVERLLDADYTCNIT